MKIWSGRSLGRSALVLFAVALLGCSGGKSATLDAGPAGDGPAVTSDTGVAPTLDGPAVTSKDAAQKDVSPTDAASDFRDAVASTDGPADAGPAYQEGWPFGRIQYDLLGGSWGEWVCGVLPQPNGQIILVGTANTAWVSSFSDPADNVFTLVRLNTDGTRDASFGTAGKTSVGMTTHRLNGCRAAVQTKDGKIVVAGDAVSSVARTGSGTLYNDDFVVARFNQDGTLDTGFGSGGMAVTNFHLTADDSGQDDKVTSMALLDDGRILVAGSMTFVQGPTYSYPAFARYTPDGAPDPTFGGAGMVILDPTSLKGGAQKNVTLNGKVSAVLADADGGTVAGVNVTGNNSGYAIAILRLGPDGTVDSSFGDGGLRWEIPESAWANLDVVQLSRNADGKLVVLADYNGSTVLYGYSAQGLVDPSFGRGGHVSRPNATAGAEQPLFMLRPADGSVLVGLGAPPVTGGYGSNTMGTFSLIRVSADGVFDDAFGELNWTWGSGAGAPVAGISSGALLANGDIVLAGYITTNRQYNTDTTALHLKKSSGN